MATNLLWRVAIGVVIGGGNGWLSHYASLAISLAYYSAETITNSNLAELVAYLFRKSNPSWVTYIFAL